MSVDVALDLLGCCEKHAVGYHLCRPNYVSVVFCQTWILSESEHFQILLNFIVSSVFNLKKKVLFKL